MSSDFGFVSFNNVKESNGDDFGFVKFGDPIKETHDQKEKDESSLRSYTRGLLQIPQGIAEGSSYGILTGLWSLIASGEINDPEEIEHIRKISEREGIPFDEEKYTQAGKSALKTIPTVSNIANAIEDEYDIHLEPKTGVDKFLRLGSTAGKFQGGTALQKGTAAVTAPTVAAGLEVAGVPEPFAELVGLGAGAGVGSKVPPIEVGKQTKPSGLPERRYENLKEPREISQKKLEQINNTIEKDFKQISERIIEESPIGETFENLKNDPTYKQQSRELLNQAQVIADESAGTISSKILKKEMADLSAKNVKGFALGEYDKSYMKFMKENMKDIKSKNITKGELVEQYRKNNAALGEYFEPGSSKAMNRAKRDALLDSNRAIANIMESQEPELAKVFKEGNQRWSKIKDAETVDSFINDLFEGKINHKNIHEFFDKSGYDFAFKRALGEKGFKDFEGLLKDMLTTEQPYKMLKVAKEKGYGELAKTAATYIISPKIGYLKAGADSLKYAYRGLINSMLDKPRIGIDFKKAIESLKKGDFKTAEKEFAVLGKEID